MYVIEQPLPAAPAANSEANVLLEWNAIYDAYNEVACLILGKPVAAYVIQMKGYVDQLERLGYVLPQDVVVGLILNGLTIDFSGFVRNYNMHNMGKIVGELHAMLIEYEKGLTKKAETPQVMMIKGDKIQKANKKSLKAKGKSKANGKGKDKQVYIPKPKNPKPSAKEHPAKDDTCHHCKEGFRETRKLKQGALYLYLGNGVCAQVEAIRSYELVLPNGLAICLDNCHYAPSILRGVVSVHRLVENGFIQHFTDFGISVSKNNVHYLNVIPSNGIYEIDMHNLVPNVNSIYNVSTKRAKHNLDSTYLWHCRLTHISKKHIEKLQREGLLKSTDYESFDQCVSCLSSKMTRKSFPHRPERVTDLLGIIHTDVCGPLRHVSRQVEDQLGKIIKALRSDRGGEYISQEFKDYLKACGIDYALESATRILNMVPTKKVDKTPYELWYGKVPNLSYLKETMGYYFYFPPENKIVVVRYAEFFEKNLITQEVSGRAIDLKEIQDEDTSPSEITSEIPMEVEGFEPPQEEDIPIRRSEKTGRAPNHLSLNVEAEEHSLGDLNEPTSYKSAMLDSTSNKWIDAMNSEIQSMMDNMVWVLVDLPPNCKTVRSKWILKKKTDMDGIVHTYKARLVAKGNTQLYGVDYEETFSPVTNIRAIRILISITAYYDYEIWKMDIKTTFLNGYLDEDIYMHQEAGIKDLMRKSKGLDLLKISMSLSYIQKASGVMLHFLHLVMVDDIIIMGNHIPSLQSVKDYLGKCFAMKDLGEASFILGIKIYRDRSKRLIGLGQNAYMDKILKRYRMDNSKRGHIPMQERLDLNKTQGASTPKEVKRMQNVPYASAVGSIMYAVRCTRPDVAFAQNITSRFQQNPGELHWTAVKNILKYLRNTKDMFLVYGGNPEAELRVDCYCNTGFEIDIDDMKSLTGYISF
ncbi:hypothetical protein Tco_1237776 [Tanacetum coccineum]